MKTRIEKYIKFAEANGYKSILHGDLTTLEALQDECFREYILDYKAYLADITSKPFIEAITRGVWSNSTSPYLPAVVTHQQAIRIRENELEQFINNLLK